MYLRIHGLNGGIQGKIDPIKEMISEDQKQLIYNLHIYNRKLDKLRHKEVLNNKEVITERNR